MKNLIRLVALLSAFLAVIFLVNYLVDPANIFYDEYDRTVASILSSGENASGVENMDDRRCLTYYATLREEPIGTLVLGSSRTLQITNAVTGDPSSYTAGMTGSDLRDCISAYFLFCDQGLVPDTVVLSPEFWYLSEANLDSRALTDGYSDFCRSVSLQPLHTPSVIWARMRNFFSFSYFQSSVNYLIAGNKKQLPTATDDFWSDSAIKRSDGSYGYSLAYRERAQSIVDQAAADKRIVDYLVTDASSYSENLASQFDAFVSFLLDQGVTVRLLLSPVHPLYYDYMKERPEYYALVFQAEAFYREIGRKYDVPVYGSYDPYALGLTGSDFYDEIHPKEEAVSRYYDLESVPAE